MTRNRIFQKFLLRSIFTGLGGATVSVPLIYMAFSDEIRQYPAEVARQSPHFLLEHLLLLVFLGFIIGLVSGLFWGLLFYVIQKLLRSPSHLVYEFNIGMALIFSFLTSLIGCFSILNNLGWPGSLLVTYQFSMFECAYLGLG
jgi:uncharacterized membrane protein YfcA